MSQTPIDERTPGGLQLPHPQNTLEKDVIRLRETLLAIDTTLADLRHLIDQRATTAALTTAVAGLGTSIDRLGQSTQFLQDNKVGIVNGLPGPAVTLAPVHLGLGPANGPSALNVQRNNSGRITQVHRTVDNKAAVQTMAYDAEGRMTSITTTYDGRTRVENYGYSGSQLVSMNAQEY